jgi:glutaredoxin
MTTKKILVYSTPTCHYCTMAKNYFTKMGVSYEDKNVGIDRVAAQEMTHLFMSKFANFDTIFTHKNRMGYLLSILEARLSLGFNQRFLRS